MSIVVTCKSGVLDIRSTGNYLSLFFFTVSPTTDIYTLSLHDALPISRRRARPSRGRSPRGPHELARGRLQRLLDALHDGPLPEVPARRHAASAGVDRSRRHGRNGAHRAPLDPRDPGREGTLRLPPGRAG